MIGWNGNLRTHIISNLHEYEAFLVERRDGGMTRYLALTELWDLAWVDEADDAVHFTRRSDAERMADHAPEDLELYICDHRWVGGTPRDRVVRFDDNNEHEETR